MVERYTDRVSSFQPLGRTYHSVFRRKSGGFTCRGDQT